MSDDFLACTAVLTPENFSVDFKSVFFFLSFFSGFSFFKRTSHVVQLCKNIFVIVDESPLRSAVGVICRYSNEILGLLETSFVVCDWAKFVAAINQS